MSTWSKERCNDSERCEETLGVPRRLEASHSTFALPRWLVGILRPIIRSLPLDVQHIAQYLSLGGGIAAELVGDDGAWHILQASQQFAKELLRSSSVAARLHQNIEHFAVLIDRAPQLLQLAIDRQIDLIEMPAISRPPCLGS
jgi:hypothetical protein